jgi:hypothetical protein
MSHWREVSASEGAAQALLTMEAGETGNALKGLGRSGRQAGGLALHLVLVYAGQQGL